MTRQSFIRRKPLSVFVGLNLFHSNQTFLSAGKTEAMIMLNVIHWCVNVRLCVRYLGDGGADLRCLRWLRGWDHQLMILLPPPQERDPQLSDPKQGRTLKHWIAGQRFLFHPWIHSYLNYLYFFFFLNVDGRILAYRNKMRTHTTWAVSHLVQCHAWQAGSHVTGLFLWIWHCVAIQSQ